MRAWYSDKLPDPGEWWWGVEHHGHAAFYLRSLMPGDFAPGGGGPAPRHVMALSGRRPASGPVACGTCGEVPDVLDLQPVERVTGDRGFLDRYRSGADRWPGRTDEDTCWLCCDPAQLVNHDETVDEIVVHVCGRCAQHLRRGR